MGLKGIYLPHLIEICIIFGLNDADFSIMMQITRKKIVTLQWIN